MAAVSPPWSLLERIAFRFVGCYLTVYGLTVIIEFIPLIDTLAGYATTLVWNNIIP